MPTTLASDNFNRANQNPINTNWVIAGGGFVAGQVFGNQYIGQNAGNAGNIYDGGVVWPNDQFCQATLQTLAVNSGLTALIVRANTINQNNYALVINALGTAGIGQPCTVTIQKFPSIVLATANITPQAGDVFKIQTVGTSIVCYQNGVQILSAVDSAAVSGKPGIEIEATGAATNIAWDNWSGGTPLVPCTVTGTLQTLTSGHIAQGKVIFQLTNIGTGNPIGVAGTSIIPALTYTAMSSQDGTFALPLWGNDNITPANTVYAVTFRDFQGNEIGPIQYSIVGSSANLNTLAAIGTTVPPVITPIAPVVYNSTGALQSSPHIVADTVTLAGGTATVTLTGNAVFTSAFSYSCVAQDETGAAACQVTQTSGSSITFTGTGTHVIRYIAVGN